MKSLNYYILDVFTSQRYKGNPLAVVWCEEELPLSQYYDIAREFGYSETSFVHYSVADKAFKVRSFTPGFYEVTGAGHNLLGAVCLALIKGWDIFREQVNEQTVIMKDEKIPLLVTSENGLHFVAMKQQPATIVGKVPPGIIATAFGLDAEALVLNNWEPMITKTEVAHVMVPVKNRQCLEQAAPNNSLLTEISGDYNFEGFYLYTTDSSESDYLAETRFFNPAFGISEDAATGTAAGPLAGYLNHVGHIEQKKSYRILQGVLINHPSSIHVRVMPEGIWVSGSSVIVMEGQLYID